MMILSGLSGHYSVSSVLAGFRSHPGRLSHFGFPGFGMFVEPKH
jgi:hypothetical protein